MAKTRRTARSTSVEGIVPPYTDRATETALGDPGLDLRYWSWFVLGWVPPTLHAWTAIVRESQYYRYGDAGHPYNAIPRLAYQLRLAIQRIGTLIAPPEQEIVATSLVALDAWNESRAQLAAERPGLTARFSGDIGRICTELCVTTGELASRNPGWPACPAWCQFGRTLGDWWLDYQPPVTEPLQNAMSRKTTGVVVPRSEERCVPSVLPILRAIRALPEPERVRAACSTLEAMAAITGTPRGSNQRLLTPFFQAMPDTRPDLTRRHANTRFCVPPALREVFPNMPATVTVDKNTGWEPNQSGELYERVLRFAEQIGDALLRMPVWPRWDRTAGRLYLGDRIVRTVKVGRASCVVLILDAFESQRWAQHIAHPEQLVEDQSQHDTIESLNDNCHGIRFHGDGGGRLAWSIRV